MRYSLLSLVAAAFLLGSVWGIGGTAQAQVSWERYPANPVLDIGFPGQWDDAYVTGPTVLRDGQTLKMWYTAYDGTHWRIGYATSPDGLAWSKYPNNPVLDLGSPGQWDNRHIAHPSVICEGSLYKMWYTGSDGSNWRIGYATSLDGVTWMKYSGNPILDIGAPGEWDDEFTFSPTIVSTTSGYRMWYAGLDGVHFRIGEASSVDGMAWVKNPDNPVLDLGLPGNWDDTNVLHPDVIRNGDVYEMWFMGQHGTAGRIGYATPLDGVTWQKFPANPVLDLGSPDQWDDSSVECPNVILDLGAFKMWYAGGDGQTTRLGYATSEPVSVTITLTPDATTVPRGETASGTLTVTNTTNSVQAVQIWTEVTTPHGDTRVSIPPRIYKLLPYQTSVNHIIQRVPPDAALGVYTYCGKVGTYPTPVIDEDCFEFTVTE